MTEHGWIRWFAAVLAAIVFTGAVYVGRRNDMNPQRERRFRPFIAPYYLPLMYAVWFILLIPLRQEGYAVKSAMDRTALGLLISFALISAYYTLMLLFLPLLRHVISPYGLSALWILPNILYLNIHLRDAPSRWVMRIDGTWLKPAAIVWGVGAAAVMGWYVYGHIRFRRELLRNVGRASAEAINVLRDEERRILARHSYELVTSPKIATPLSIGLFPRTTKIVLPERAYTADELRLILRHELTHIRRQDAWTKVFIALCTAASWFNPFVWLAMRRASEDFELGCDDQVLYGEDDETRRTYARLILTSVGESRGFTTSLSATARSLRYRLASIVHPKKRLIGGLLVGLTAGFLIFSCGQIALAYSGGSAQDAVFAGCSAAELGYSGDIVWWDDSGAKTYALENPEGLTEYILALRVYRFIGELDNTEPNIRYVVTTPEGPLMVALFDSKLVVRPAHGHLIDEVTYYHGKAIDWDYLRGFLGEDFTKVPHTTPILKLFFREMEPADFMWCDYTVLRKTVDGVEQDVSHRTADGVGGLHLYVSDDVVKPTSVELVFSDDPTAYDITVESWDRSERYTVPGDTLEGRTLPLAADSARYTVRADYHFEDGSTVTDYQIEYSFDVSFEG